MARFADILLPIAQPIYTFAVGDLSLSVGDAVAVQFGKRGVWTGIVWRLHDNAPSCKAKPILRRLYDRSVVSAEQIRFWEWMAEYYMCTEGEVMRMALPSLIKARASDEESFEPYTPRQNYAVRLCEGVADDVVSAVCRRAPRRAALVGRLQECGGELPRSALAGESSTIAALEKSGVVETIVCKGAVGPIVATPLPELTAAQEVAHNDIVEGWTSKRVALLHGVTGSGKTEIYMHLAAEALLRGEQVLYLVPEISLTAQLVERLERVFGDRVIAYHSKLTPVRRTSIYTSLLHEDEPKIVIGARSALFLPFSKLGLIVVDEEHDASYKQTEPNPRYHGRDAAVMLASIFNARVVMGSGTPSVDSYANVLAGKYAMATIDERYGGASMPRIIISDTLRAIKRGERHNHLNKDLADAIEERLSRGEQVILFQNRRGVAPFIECSNCGWTPRCPRCNVTLSYHSNNILQCHYCGHTMPMPQHCPSCNQASLETMGFGTERVEDVVSLRFPSARVLRLDRDTATSDAAYRRIIGAFARHEADILVGTQIITKGLDFGGVTLVGILNGDNLLSSPDFRGTERAWQTIMQVAGRCGRRDKAGEVYVQSAETDNPVYRWVVDGRYKLMAHALLHERQRYNYPPYTRLLRITLRSANTLALFDTAKNLGERLRNRFSQRVFGPVPPLVDRIRGEFILEITLKIEVSASFARARSIVREEIAAVSAEKHSRAVAIICDVDIQ